MANTPTDTLVVLASLFPLADLAPPLVVVVDFSPPPMVIGKPGDPIHCELKNIAKTARSASDEQALGIFAWTVLMRLVFLHMHATSVGVCVLVGLEM